MKAIFIVGMKSVVFLAILASSVALHAEEAATPLDDLYRRAQREFHRKNYERALPMLKSYVEKSKTQRYKRDRLFWVIDQIGRIYLRERRDPDGAIAFFKKLSEHKRLTDAEYQIIEEWLSGAKEWKDHGAMADDVVSADILFENGKRFYQKGLALQQYPSDDSGDAYFHIAASYLVPFIVNFDEDPRIGEALLMMGVVRHNSWTDSEYWSDNFYLREAIRRFPHTPIAKKAYEMLEHGVRLGYTGSSGDNTPKSLLRMLHQFKKLAEPENAVKEKKDKSRKKKK